MNALYEALDSRGCPYTREPRTIGELPFPQRRAALDTASQRLATEVGLPLIQPVNYGRPSYHAFELALAQAKQHEGAALLLLKGEELPV